MKRTNDVDSAMDILGIKTLREFASMCRVSEKTMIGWRNNKITPLGKAIIEVYLENHSLKVELEKMQRFRSVFREIIDN